MHERAGPANIFSENWCARPTRRRVRPAKSWQPWRPTRWSHACVGKDFAGRRVSRDSAYWLGRSANAEVFDKAFDAWYSTVGDAEMTMY